jgi:hypothetical protein
MHLITMAHLGEAQGVIDLFNLTRVSPQVFEGSELVCLITGEGPFEAATLTANQLGQKKFSTVINLGIAGSMSSTLPIGSIHPVRSVYLVIDGKPQFKSFKSFDKGLDCVTSFERILNKDKAVPLTGIGSLVDREAWGVATAAKSAGIPFQSFKLISDEAGTLGACEVAREKSEEWSQKLAIHLKSILVQTANETPLFEMAGFHFTFTTRHKFEQLLKKVALRDELTQDQVLNSLPLEDLRKVEITSKERTRILLDFLDKKLDPLKEKLETGLSNWKESFEKKGIALQTDPTWESSEIKISFSVSNDEDLKQKLHLLDTLKLKPFIDLRSGNIHVE